MNMYGIVRYGTVCMNIFSRIKKKPENTDSVNQSDVSSDLEIKKRYRQK